MKLGMYITAPEPISVAMTVKEYCLLGCDAVESGEGSLMWKIVLLVVC
jgi:hypothetical protein